ncbi:MAG: SDR family oxidoreductase [Planctomycetota bacterium]|nr:SDR family oxidoreductase [Planctomycetota bacterium]
MKSLANKKILLTGAASGIGRALALKLAKEGALLALLDCDEVGLVSLMKDLPSGHNGCFPVLCDLSSETQIEQATQSVIQEWQALDVLINNAGVGFHGPTHEMTPAERSRLIQINLHAPFSLFQHCVHYLMNSESGHVVNVSSIFGLVPHQQTTAYSTSKYALVGFSEALRAEYGRWGLGVTCVCPGFVRTPMVEALPAQSRSGQSLRKPASWLMTTPEKVADKMIRGIKKNKRLVLATPLAHFLYHSKRLFPGLFDFVQSFKTTRIKTWLGIRKTAKTNLKPAQPDPDLFLNHGHESAEDSKKAA